MLVEVYDNGKSLNINESIECIGKIKQIEIVNPYFFIAHLMRENLITKTGLGPQMKNFV